MKLQLIALSVGLFVLGMMEVVFASGYGQGSQAATDITNAASPLNQKTVSGWLHQDGHLEKNEHAALPSNDWMVNAAKKTTADMTFDATDFSTENTTDFHCAQGECDDGRYAPSTQFGPHVAKLMGLMGGAKSAVSLHMAQLLPGGIHQCHEAGFGYNNCCKQKGWGQDFGWAGCNSAEQQLGDFRRQRRCIYVGNYCARKKGKGRLSRCVEHRQSWCCYESPLARLIQTQGHAQLNWGYGNAKHPHCQGFTLAQFQSLNFDRMNFNELAATLTASAKPLNKASIEATIKAQTQALASEGRG